MQAGKIRNERDHGPDALPVLLVVIAEEHNQVGLLGDGPITEELPQHERISHEAEGISQDELRAQPPVEEAEVARVPEDGVEARRDEHVGLGLPGLDQVVEAGAGLQHGEGSDHLPTDGHDEARGHKDRSQAKGRPGAVGEEDADEETLQRGGCVGDGEAVDLGVERVPLGSGPELEEVEEGEGEEEEGGTPDGVVGEDEDGGHGDEAGSKGDAQAESTQGDAGEGSGLPGEERLEPLGHDGRRSIFKLGLGFRVVSTARRWPDRRIAVLCTRS
ncbi:unnamed protein product [Clonostachys chloroleuca]|uniref:Uncharacterized protein n=1 Tax=Clonostachys chloroleuca TaxID=1926264 RepID=A0AA35Q544_9HYPO|nr:unnamed protein product [Clonostachys chloroleuca]